MKKILFLLLLLLIQTTCEASLTIPNYSKGYILSGVPVANEVVYQNTTLSLTGSGVLNKHIAISKVKLFVLQYFTENENKFQRNEVGAAASIPNVGKVAMTLTFLHSLDASMISDNIGTLLNANLTTSEQSLYQSQIGQFEAILANESIFVAGGSLTIAGQGNVAYVENQENVVTTINANDNSFMTLLFKIFIGTPIDNDGANLKYQLLQDPALVFNGVINL